MTGDPAIAAAVIGVCGAVIAALLGVIGTMLGLNHRATKKAASSVSEVLKQVRNSHPMNLRDDLDEKFEGLAVLVKTAVADIGGIKSDIRQIHSDQTRDREAATQAARDAARAAEDARRALERTRPIPPKPRRNNV